MGATPDDQEQQFFAMMEKESANLRKAAKEACTLLGGISRPVPEISNLIQALKLMEMVKIEMLEEAIANVETIYQAFIQRAEADQNIIEANDYVLIIKGMTAVGQEIINLSIKADEISGG